MTTLGTFAEMSAARATLQLTIDRLRVIGSGETLTRIGEKVEAMVSGYGRSKLAKHKLSGNAESTYKVTRLGGLIQEHGETYLDFHPWWPFRGGRMPGTVIAFALKTASAEYYAALEGLPSPLVVAEDEAVEASRAKFKRDTAKIARRIFAASPAGALARAAKAKATRAAKAGKP